MESLVIKKIEKPEQKISLPNLEAYYPFTTIYGRLIETKVVGVTFEGRQEVVAQLRMGDKVWLEMEPNNSYDCNAIKVSRENGEQIGYINRHLAADIVQYFRVYGYPVHGEVALLTGSRWDGFSLGCIVSFNLPLPKRINKNIQLPSFDDWDQWDD